MQQPITGVGVGLRAPHYDDFLAREQPVSWLEVHSENYFQPHSHERAVLETVADGYPLSFHGIGLSLGSADPLNQQHLGRLKALVSAFSPALLSEHLSWSSIDGRYFNDLLPLPMNSATLAHVCQRVDQVQQLLGRQLLIENPSSYLAFTDSDLPEWAFLAELHRRTGCGLLLDLNNIYVSSQNLGFSTAKYLDGIPWSAVGEIHLAGHARRTLANGSILIDTHGSVVAEPVWQLYVQVCAEQEPIPTLIEWDSDIPPLATLLGEAKKAETIRSRAAIDSRRRYADTA